MAEKCAELVAWCFGARTAAHYAHLKTRSYAQHVALQTFYEDIVTVTDEFAEAAMGVDGLIEAFPDKPLPTTEPLKFIPELRTWLRDNRAYVADGSSELANLVDEIIAVCDRAIYRLRFLK